VGFDNCLRDGKPHPRPRDPVPLVFAPIELEKNLIDFRFLYAWSQIRDMKKDKSILFLSRDRDGFSGGGVQVRIPDEMPEDLSRPE
jgi:hypothetical protein